MKNSKTTRTLFFVTALSATVLSHATPPVGQPLPAGALRTEHENLSIVAGADFHGYYYAMRGTWWGLAEISTPDFDDDRNYAELWLHPRVNATYQFDENALLYAGLSVGITRDIGENAFGYADQGAERFENAFVGYAFGSQENWHVDVSAGSQPFTLGTGMLLHAGAINGNEWGNTASCKRIAWRRTAIARIGYGNISGQAFWLDPNEVPSNESKTRIAGASLEWADTSKGKAGIAYIKVPQSEFFYPGGLAPFVFIENGREGLTAYHGWSELHGLLGLDPAFSLRAEFAIEKGKVDRITGQRDDMNAFGGYIGASYWFQQLPFAPKLTYGYAYFSGDDPDTDEYERFDPLYWGNGLDNWWFGANGSYSFINSNVQFHRITLDAFMSAQDIFKLQWVRANADELNSPLQFGQAVRFEPGSVAPTVGVTDHHLTDEIMLQYVHVFTPTLTLSGYLTHSMPRQGIESLATSGSDNWTTLGFGLSASF